MTHPNIPWSSSPEFPCGFVPTAYAVLMNVKRTGALKTAFCPKIARPRRQVLIRVCTVERGIPSFLPGKKAVLERLAALVEKILSPASGCVVHFSKAE